MMLFGIWALVGLCKTAYLHFNSHSPGESGLVDFPQFSASLVLVKNLTGWVVQVTMGWMSLLSPSQECHSTGGKVVSWWAVSWLVYDAVQVNAHESIILNSWVSRVQYNALCHVLGTGMSIHLQVYIYIYILVVVISLTYWSCEKLLLIKALKCDVDLYSYAHAE